MKKKTVNTFKLGIFVLTGMLILIYALYALARTKTFFGNRFELKTHFRDVNGLLVGNNVRFSGIDVGSVRNIVILNDTTVEVTLDVEQKMKSFIRANAVATVGTDGLIGNRVVNIEPVNPNAPYVAGGELLPSQEEVDTKKMLQTLYGTNENVAKIVEDLRNTVHLVSTSSELSSILNDKTLSANLRASLYNLKETTEKASRLMDEASGTLQLASKGRGNLATLLTDTTLSTQLPQIVDQIKQVGKSADNLVQQTNSLVSALHADVQRGPGSANTLLRDSLLAEQLKVVISNTEKGTAAFAQDMEALKHNFLFRRYFKKLEKKEKK